MANLTLYLACLAAIGLSGCSDTIERASGVDAADQSIVTTTLCADSYVLAMPELSEKLAAMSWQSRSSLSRAPQALQALPQTDDDPERRLRWKGAQIISSASTNGDINLVWGEDFENVWDNFALLSGRFEVADPSNALRARLDALPVRQIKPKLLYLNRSGGTAGAETFVDAVFNAAGAENIIKTAGWQSPDTEALLALKPDAIVTSFMGSNYVGVNDRTVRHSALAQKLSTVPTIDVHGGLWPCAGPGLVDATVQISDALSAL